MSEKSAKKLIFSQCYHLHSENFQDKDSNGNGNDGLYVVWGAATTEIEVDCLTGDVVILESDIVMDIGKSMNPAVDIGQIEGAFVQGKNSNDDRFFIFSI